ncbi:MAG: hypothetical protein JKY37_09155 [Nannocystaceae bacterium]|nr:hypothetical protein [Nannocystaceae bacterium]
MRIRSLLRRLYPEPPQPDAAVREALEAELLRSISGRAAPSRSAVSRAGLLRRWLVGGALTSAALVGACVVPADYELSVGHRIVVSLDGHEHDFDPEALARHLEGRFEFDEIRVMVAVSKSDSGAGEVRRMQLAMDLVGGADIEAVEVSMLERFPVLADADIDIEALDGTVHGTFGGMLSERTLGLRLDTASVEETRARILAELAARGLEGRAKVEITDEYTPSGHRREVRVEVQAQHVGSDG